MRNVTMSHLKQHGSNRDRETYDKAQRENKQKDKKAFGLLTLTCCCFRLEFDVFRSLMDVFAELEKCPLSERQPVLNRVIDDVMHAVARSHEPENVLQVANTLAQLGAEWTRLAWYRLCVGLKVWGCCIHVFVLIWSSRMRRMQKR